MNSKAKNVFLNKVAIISHVKTKQPQLKDSIAASYKPLVEYIARKLHLISKS